MIWLRIDDACLPLEKLFLGEEFYRQGRPHRIRVLRIHITSVQAEFFDARRPLVLGRAFAHLDGSDERIPGAAAPILFHTAPGRVPRRFYSRIPHSSYVF